MTFEGVWKKYISEETTEHHHHHEQGFCTQKTFREQSLCLVEAINDMGNPFVCNSSELLVLDTQNIISESVVHTVCTVEEIGRDQYINYHKSVIVERTLNTWSNQELFPTSVQKSNIQDQEQAGWADPYAEQWCGTLFTFVHCHAALGGRNEHFLQTQKSPVPSFFIR